MCLVLFHGFCFYYVICVRYTNKVPMFCFSLYSEAYYPLTYLKCIVLLSTEYFYAVQHLISWLNLIHLIPQPNALTSGHLRGSPAGNP